MKDVQFPLHSDVTTGNAGKTSEPRFKGETAVQVSGVVAESIGERLTSELHKCWRRGERRLAEEFLAQHPGWERQPEIAIDVIYEEFCLRSDDGEADTAESLFSRFPQWRQQLATMFDCHRLLAGPDFSRFPEVGQTLAGFRLLAELDRGSRGRVFLAQQGSLGDRRVVLKVTPRDGAEHISLARLQHTAIMPIYSTFDNASRDLRVLCMPWLGGVTLAGLLRRLKNVPLAERTGRDVIDALDQDSPELRQTPCTSSPIRSSMMNSGYVDTICQIGVSIADALHYAHERGLLHLDVKPSNILLAADGQPMLLDFHLARAPVTAGEPVAGGLGGTLAYMPPEQNFVLADTTEGRPATASVDSRSDVYSLGATLYEMLSDRTPVYGQPMPALADINPYVSVGLSDIVAKCLCQRTDDRYSSATELAVDLRHHLADESLAFTANRSLSERWRKYHRRHPRSVQNAILMTCFAAASLWMVCVGAIQLRQRLEDARASLAAGKLQAADREYTRAEDTLNQGLSLVWSGPFHDPLEVQLRAQLDQVRRLRTIDELHELTEHLRVIPGTQPNTPKELTRLAEKCRYLWGRRAGIVESLDVANGSDAAGDLQDLAVFLADTGTRFASQTELDVRRTQSLKILDEAEAMFGSSRVLDFQRAICSGEKGLVRQFNDDFGSSQIASQSTTKSSTHSVWEHCAIGRGLFAENNFPSAMTELEMALKLDPSATWPNFYAGLCANQQGRHEEALTAFSVCIGALPNQAVCFYNRAIALFKLGRTNPALADYDHAIRLEPNLASAWLNRGILHCELGDYSTAITDLREAKRLGIDSATVHYNIALVHVAEGDRASATLEIDHALASGASQNLASLIEQIQTEKSLNRVP